MQRVEFFIFPLNLASKPTKIGLKSSFLHINTYIGLLGLKYFKIKPNSAPITRNLTLKLSEIDVDIKYDFEERKQSISKTNFK